MLNADFVRELRDATNGEVTQVTIDKPHGAFQKLAIIPPNYQAKVLYEKPAAIPENLVQHVDFDQIGAFAAYLNRFGTKEGTVIFQQQDGTKVTMLAVVDYHRLVSAEDEDVYTIEPGQAVLQSWCKHRANFAPILTPEWNTWIGNNKTYVEQADFARFLEDNQPDIKTPNAGELIDICRNLSLVSNITYTKANRELDGQINFSYKEDNGPGGNLKVPEQITLDLVPFRGEQPVEVVARLRYRLQNGQCRLSYDLVRPHKVLEAAAKNMAERLDTLTEGKFLTVSGLPSLPELDEDDD